MLERKRKLVHRPFFPSLLSARLHSFLTSFLLILFPPKMVGTGAGKGGQTTISVALIPAPVLKTCRSFNLLSWLAPLCVEKKGALDVHVRRRPSVATPPFLSLPIDFCARPPRLDGPLLLSPYCLVARPSALLHFHRSLFFFAHSFSLVARPLFLFLSFSEKNSLLACYG